MLVPRYSHTHKENETNCRRSQNRRHGTIERVRMIHDVSHKAHLIRALLLLSAATVCQGQRKIGKRKERVAKEECQQK